MDGSSARPVHTLREHASRLEAAVTVSLAKSKPKAVHALRSETRRVEAQMELLAMLHQVPAHRAEADKVLRRLKKLRSVAGKVRDCDVQRKLLKNGGAGLTTAPEASKDVPQNEKRLRKVLGRDRDRYEKRLRATVSQQQKKLAGDLEMLLDALKPNEEFEASSAALLKQVTDRFVRVLYTNSAGEEHLHDLRKTAKRARYQCESLTGPEAAAMAKEFEGLQDAGGEWHDLLELAIRAHDEFGADHPLSRVLEHRRDQHLDHYTQLLDEFRATHPEPKRLHASGKRAAHAGPRKPAKRVRAAKAVKARASKGAMRKAATRTRRG